MPYKIILIGSTAKKKEEENLNRLAEKYKSFRVIAMTDYQILVWFDAKDFELYKTDVSQVN